MPSAPVRRIAAIASRLSQGRSPANAAAGRRWNRALDEASLRGQFQLFTTLPLAPFARAQLRAVVGKRVGRSRSLMPGSVAERVSSSLGESAER
jgi:hypothetical protein